MSDQKMTSAQEKKAERTKLFEDVYSGVIPKRVPIKASMTLEAALEYSEIPVGKTLWDLDPENITAAMDRVCEFIPSDTPRRAYGTYVFTVRDNGVGMSAEFIEKIGKPFEQETNIFHKSELGSGLGLSIVKNLVSLKGGTLDIESEKGQGTTTRGGKGRRKAQNHGSLLQPLLNAGHIAGHIFGILRTNPKTVAAANAQVFNDLGLVIHQLNGLYRGAAFSANFPIRLTPPKVTIPKNTQSRIPPKIIGSPKERSKVLASELECSPGIRIPADH